MKEKGDQIVVSKNMIDILERFKRNSFQRPISKKKRTALAALRVGKMKRKRTVSQKKTISAKLGSVNIPKGANARLFQVPYKIKRQRENPA